MSDERISRSFLFLLGSLLFPVAAVAAGIPAPMAYAPDVPPPIERNDEAVLEVHLETTAVSVEIAPGVDRGFVNAYLFDRVNGTTKALTNGNAVNIAVDLTPDASNVLFFSNSTDAVPGSGTTPIQPLPSASGPMPWIWAPDL